MNNRITILNNKDGTVDVKIDGENVERVPSSTFDQSIHAVQWYGDRGEVEYNNRNESITDLTSFNFVFVERQIEIDRREAEILANKPSLEDEIRTERDSLLFYSDWVVVKHTELGIPVPENWVKYRQELRDITKQEGFPENVTWPILPEL